MSSIRQHIRSRLSESKDVFVIIKDDKESELQQFFENTSILDQEYDQSGFPKLEKVDISSLLEGKIFQTESESRSDQIESNIDAQTDFLIVDNKELEVGVLKVLNQGLNDYMPDDSIYYVISLEIQAGNESSSILELKKPKMLRKTRLLRKREKAQYDAQTKIIRRVVNPLSFKLSFSVEGSKDGSLDFSEMDSLNEVLKYVDKLLAYILEPVYKSDLGISPEKVGLHSMMIQNKPRIKNAIRKMGKEDLKILNEKALREYVNNLANRLYEENSIHPLTDNKLTVKVTISKIHKKNVPNAFTSTAYNVTLLGNDNVSMKIERLPQSIERSVPYLEDQEEDIKNKLFDLIQYFIVLAENSSRNTLDYVPIPGSEDLKLKDLYPDQKEVFDVLGLTKDQQDRIEKTVEAAVNKLISDAKMTVDTEVTNKLADALSGDI